MGQLHELLAAEKTRSGAWHTLYEETLKKFANEHFFNGHSKSLKMLEDSPANQAVEDQAHEYRVVPTNVFDTLHYALGIFADSEDLQFQKNATNANARGTVEFRGMKFADLPVDELLGLEARITKIRALYAVMPTLDAAKNWKLDEQMGAHIWVADPEHTTKTEKIVVPVQMSPATDKHPAQVQAVQKDNIVGKFTTIKRSGGITAVQKSDAIKLVDELLVEIKKARMRANETPVVSAKIGESLVTLLLSPLLEI